MDIDFNQEELINEKVLKWTVKKSIVPELQRCLNAKGSVFIWGDHGTNAVSMLLGP